MIMNENEKEIKITVYCDSCIDGFSDYGTKSELEAVGWLIENGLDCVRIVTLDKRLIIRMGSNSEVRKCYPLLIFD
jgi:hypothetical protein